MKIRKLVVGVGLAACVSAVPLMAIQKIPVSNVISASAYTTEEINNITYNMYDDHVEVYSGEKSALSLEIENVVDGLPVTIIDSQAFDGASNLRSVIIPEGITSVGSYAFRSCSSLESIEIPDTVTNIGSSAFSGCESLNNIKLSANLKSISEYMFRNCSSLTSLTLPDSIEKVLDYYSNPFYGCTSLTELSVPDSITSISKGAYFPESVTDLTVRHSDANINSKILSEEFIPASTSNQACITV